MNEATCEGCGAIYIVTGGLPRNMRCFCKEQRFKIKARK